MTGTAPGINYRLEITRLKMCLNTLKRHIDKADKRNEKLMKIVKIHEKRGKQAMKKIAVLELIIEQKNILLSRTG